MKIQTTEKYLSSSTEKYEVFFVMLLIFLLSGCLREGSVCNNGLRTDLDGVMKRTLAPPEFEHQPVPSTYTEHAIMVPYLQQQQQQQQQ